MNKSYMVVFLFMTVMVTFFSICIWASRQEDSCNPDTESCKDLSSDFTVPYCVSLNAPVVDYALDCVWPSVTNVLSSIQEREDEDGNKLQSIPLGRFDTRNVVELYCKAMLWTGNMWRIYYSVPSNLHNGWDWQQTFDSHQSIFVNALCLSFKDKNGEVPLVDELYLGGVFKNEDLAKVLKLKQRSWWKDLCSLADYENLDDCDMSIYATEIFSAIMSDMFKIKYAQVLHIDNTENFEAEYRSKVEAFMSGYFNMNPIEWDYRRLKATFPQTISILESNQKYYKRVLDTVKILDNTALADNALASGCPIDWNMTLVDFVACALHSSQWKWFSLTPSFITMFYNEVMSYRIFELYMNSWIDEKVKEMTISKRDEKDIRKFLSKSLDFQWYANIQIEASKQALLRFEDFNMSYPLHIWLLLYQESMKNFRDNRLSPIVTLFYSLSEKLQNVQLPN